MMLTPVDPEAITPILEAYAASLDDPDLEGEIAAARLVWQRIAASRHRISQDSAPWSRDAVALCDVFGMNPRMIAPQQSLSWTGTEVSALTEPAVLLHEVAHFQLAPPERRHLPDFGLGAGPESGDIALAGAAQRRHGIDREIEEQRTSLLGILWETALDQPAILAFQEQNWLEGCGRRSSAQFFVTVLTDLIRMGLVDGEGLPLLALNCMNDRF